MRRSLMALCDNFIENRTILKNTFKWQDAELYGACAAIFSDQRKIADKERLLEMKALVKSQFGIFSDYRGNAEVALLSYLSILDDPKDALKKTQKLYEPMKKQFKWSSNLTLACLLVMSILPVKRYAATAQTAREIYDFMNKKHPLLTGSEDAIFCIMMTLLNDDPMILVERAEEMYGKLTNLGVFPSKNAVQSLANLLLFVDGDPDEKVRRVYRLYQSLREEGRKYDVWYGLSTIGILAMLPEDIDDLVKEVYEVDAYLAEQKGYTGFFGMSKDRRLVEAAMLVCSDHIGTADNVIFTFAQIAGILQLIASRQAAAAAAA